MSRRAWWIVVIFLAYVVGVGAKPERVEPVPRGATSPRRLLERAARAVRTKNVALLAACVPGRNELERKTAELTARVMLLTDSLDRFVKRGKGKFGEKPFLRALGDSASPIGALLMSHPPFQSLLKKGVMEVEGDRARCTHKVKRSATLTQDWQVEMNKIEGRWYLLGPSPKGLPKLRRLEKKLRVYLKYARESLERSETVDQFKVAFEERPVTVEWHLVWELASQPTPRKRKSDVVCLGFDFETKLVIGYEGPNQFSSTCTEDPKPTFSFEIKDEDGNLIGKGTGGTEWRSEVFDVEITMEVEANEPFVVEVRGGDKMKYLIDGEAAELLRFVKGKHKGTATGVIVKAYILD